MAPSSVSCEYLQWFAIVQNKFILYLNIDNTQHTKIIIFITITNNMTFGLYYCMRSLQYKYSWNDEHLASHHICRYFVHLNKYIILVKLISRDVYLLYNLSITILRFKKQTFTIFIKHTCFGINCDKILIYEF